MEITAISTATSQFTSNLKQVYMDLLISKTPFTVHVSTLSSSLSVPFDNGVLKSNKVEHQALNTIKRVLGAVHIVVGG